MRFELLCLCCIIFYGIHGKVESENKMEETKNILHRKTRSSVGNQQNQQIPPALQRTIEQLTTRPVGRNSCTVEIARRIQGRCVSLGINTAFLACQTDDYVDLFNNDCNNMAETMGIGRNPQLPYVPRK